ncbi:MAG: protoporphyrinogen oxidase, partial [candidate division Zixibacteria bacterium]
MAKYDVAIIGGGISGLAALHYVKTRRPELTVRLFEAEKRLGGTVGTDSKDGFSFDWGPNGFLDREPLTLQLCDELGLSDQLERANDNVSNRFILRKGKLRGVPMSPPAFMASSILSLPGRMRILREPLAPGPPDGVDESIYDFVKRRIGREAADYLVQPLVSGVYGGMADRLSLKSCFPIMHEMEAEYGSLIKALIAKAKKAKAKGKRGGGPSGPGGWLTSFKGGLDQIIKQFEITYRDHIAVDSAVESMAKRDSGTDLTFASGDKASASQLILAVPSYVASTLT